MPVQARLRRQTASAEAELILKWVEQARQVQAKGQVILDANNPANVVLENNDVIRMLA